MSAKKPSNLFETTFFQKPSEEVARAILGQYLVRQRTGEDPVYNKITEIEIYEGFEDRASHAHRGKTPRNAIMFGPGGYWYVYLCYGVHWLLNLVTGPPDYPAAILFRGIESVTGPGRLTKKLAIDKTQNQQPASPASGLWLEKSGPPLPASQIKTAPRIGIDYAGPQWKAKKWRFLIT
ncbi:MAG: DNA-3-methyladenine glycosylase [Opitutales bacterium]|nr:DNA-3-methyladenine glycosylase [Opitutales bacterium]